MAPEVSDQGLFNDQTLRLKYCVMKNNSKAKHRYLAMYSVYW